MSFGASTHENKNSLAILRLRPFWNGSKNRFTRLSDLQRFGIFSRSQLESNMCFGLTPGDETFNTHLEKNIYLKAKIDGTAAQISKGKVSKGSSMVLINQYVGTLPCTFQLL